MKRRTFIHSIMIGTGTILIGEHALGKNPAGTIKVSMVYNNVGGGSMHDDWGLSIFFQQNDTSLLFDTGRKPEVLLENLHAADIDPAQISKIVISHNHGDHVNGLDVFFDESGYAPHVYVPENSLEAIHRNFKKAHLIGVNEQTKINDFVWSTGQLEGRYRNGQLFEQSLIVKQDTSLYLFTGCSHPGIINIVEKTRRIFPEDDIKLVAGGFHLIDHTEKQIYDISHKLKNLSVEKIAPSHCTGDVGLRIFQDEWGYDFVTFDLSTNQISIRSSF